MDVKKHITALGFIPKNGTSGIYHKIYSDHNNYVISIDFDKEHIEYGDLSSTYKCNFLGADNKQ